MTLASGTRLGVYDIREVIGAGGMGEVYRAHDTKLGREVAIKILPDQFAADADRLARFEREARVLASLNHPNIAAIYGFEEPPAAASGQAAVRALVLELVDGETLVRSLEAGPRPIEHTLAIARQLVDALDAAHEKGIVHRDLKPANIKVKPDGTVKVLDFGLAKAFDAAGSEAPRADQSLSPTFMQTAVNSRVIIGTAAYMSPEQARGRPADKRSDIWAFGCVLYEMLTGRSCFAASEVSDTLALVLTKEPDWAALPPATPPAVRRLLRRCLEKDRNRRLADISDARLELSDSGSDASSIAAPALVARRPSVLPWVIATVAGLLAVGLAVPSILYLRHAPADTVVTHVEITTPPTTDPMSFALSPDGRLVTFVATSEGLSRLWIRSLDRSTALPLVGTDGASYPFWAPDGRAVGFFADGKLKRIDRSGGAALTLADASGPRGGTWSRDDVILFAPSTTGGLMRVPASGGTPTVVTRLARGQGSHRWPQFLPDGRHFLFFVALTKPEQQGVYVTSLDGGDARLVANAETAASFVAPDWLLVTRQNVLMAYRFDVARGTISGEPVPAAQAVGFDGGLFRAAVAATPTVLAHRAAGAGRRQLQWFDRAGIRRGEIGAPDDNVLAYPELALDDRHLSIRRTVQGNLDLWLWDIPRGAMSRFTSDYALDNMAVWSPDLQTIVFSSIRQSGVYELFEKPASGVSEERPFLASPESKAAMSWSRDGRFLLYTSDNARNRSDLWAVPMTGDRKPFPWLQTIFDETAAQFSPDGRWVAYQSSQSGRYEIFVRPFPGPGSEFQASTAGGIWPRWRRDGKELFYISPDNRLMAVPIANDGRSPKIDPGVPVALFQPRLLAGGGINVGGFLARAQYDVASDGRFLFNTNVDEAVSPPINIVLNWTSDVKRQ